jgi:hypothetical protein
MRAEEQMVWVDAISVVAGVTDEHSIRDGAFEDFVRSPVGDY